MEAAAGEELLLRQDYLVSMSWACSSTGCSGAENNTHPLTILEARSLRPSSGQDPAPSEALWVDPSASPSIWWLFLGRPCFAVPCLRFLPLLSCGCLPCVCLCLLFFLNLILVYLFWVALDLCCCRGFSLVVACRGYSLVAVRGLLIAVASLVTEL